MLERSLYCHARVGGELGASHISPFERDVVRKSRCKKVKSMLPGSN